MAKYRFSEFRPESLTLEKLSEDVGISVSQLSRFESGEREPRVGELLRIAERFNVPWQEIVEEGAANWNRVPKVSWVSAGRLDDPGVEIDMDGAHLIPVAGLTAGEWIALEVQGDSMDRISPPGSTILVNRREKALVPNACYVIATNDGATYKRYRPEPARFEPVTYNDAHQPLFPEGEVRVIGRVRRTILDM